MMLTTQEITTIENQYCDPTDRFWRVFDALGECARYRLVKILMYHDSLCVADLAKICGMTSSAVCQHLAILEEVGIVRKETQGRKSCYCISSTDSEIGKIIAVIDEHFEKSKHKEA